MAEDQCAQDLLAAQEGLVTKHQLRALGFSREKVRWAAARRWSAVLPNVLSTHGPHLTPRRRMVGALLHAGDGAMLGSLTAAAWHGVTSSTDHRVHVTAPASRHPRSTGFVVVHRTTRSEPQPWHRGPLVVVSRARAVVDAARDAAHHERALAIVCEAVERRLVTPAALRDEVECGPRTGSAIVRQAVERVEAGAWSVPESDLLDLIEACPALPVTWGNPTLQAADGTRLPTPDAWFDDVALAVQVHSRRWHSTPDQWDATVMTDGILIEHGIVVVGVTPRALRTAPDLVLHRLSRAYGHAQQRSRPEIQARPA
jgi:hypothetical protein